MTDKLTGDEILEAHGSTDVLEELLQSVTAQALRMGRVEDGQHELRASLLSLQHVVEQIGVGEVAQNADGNADNGLREQLDEVDKAAKHAARRSGIVLFVVILQLILLGGLIGQSYLKMSSSEAPPPPAVRPVEAPKPPEAAAVVAPPPVPAPEPTPQVKTPDKTHHGKNYHGKK